MTKPANIVEYKKWLAGREMFLTRWHRKLADAQWEFLDVCHRTGIISKVPAQNKYPLFVCELSA